MKYLDEKNQLIMQMWNEGASAGVIGKAVGLTRNGVMGRVTRMRIKGFDMRVVSETDTLNRKVGSIRGIKSRERSDYIPPPIREVIVQAIAPPPKLEAEGRWVSILETGRNNCRYTHDGKTFCNAEGFPYCPEHHQVIRHSKQF